MPDPTPVAIPPKAPPPTANGAPPPAAATPPAPPAATESDKDGTLLAQLRQREKALVERQQRERRELEQDRSRLAAERAEVQRMREEHQAAMRQAEERRVQEQAGKDPFRLVQLELQRRGEAQDRKIAELEAKLVQQERASMSATQQANMDRELGVLVGAAKESAKERPHTAKYAEKSEKKLRAMAVRVARDELQAGVRLTNEEILDRIEEELAEEASVWTDSGKAPNSASPTSESGSTPSRAGNVSTAQPTLTSAREGERVAELSEAELAKLSPAERKQRTLAMLAQMRAERLKAKAAGK